MMVMEDGEQGGGGRQGFKEVVEVRTRKATLGMTMILVMPSIHPSIHPSIRPFI